MIKEYTLLLHSETYTDLICIKASSLENALYAAQWLYKGKLVTVPMDLYQLEEVC
jgi:hypothetical protein